MVFKKCLTLFLILSLLLNCERAENTTNENIPVVYIDWRQPKTISTEQFFHHTEFVPLELTRESGISDVVDLEKLDSLFILTNYIETSRAAYILAFNREGDFKWQIDPYYDGPGSFNGYSDMTILGDSIVEIVSRTERKVLQYSKDGSYKDEIHVDGDIYGIAGLPNGQHAYWRSYIQNYGSERGKRSLFNVSYFNSQGKTINRYFDYIEPALADFAGATNVFYPMHNSPYFYYLAVGHDTITKISDQGSSPFAVIDHPYKKEQKSKLDELSDMATDKKMSHASFAMLVLSEYLNRPNSLNNTLPILDYKDKMILPFSKNGNKYFTCFNKSTNETTVFLLDNPSLFLTSRFFPYDDQHFAIVYRNPYQLWDHLERDYPEFVEGNFNTLKEKEPNPYILLVDYALFDEIN
jgi:hypothetical protein